jgi:hypothetical protein
VVFEEIRDGLQARNPDAVGRAIVSAVSPDRYVVHLQWGPVDGQQGEIHHDLRLRDGRIQHMRDCRHPPRRRRRLIG